MKLRACGAGLYQRWSSLLMEKRMPGETTSNESSSAIVIRTCDSHDLLGLHHVAPQNLSGPDDAEANQGLHPARKQVHLSYMCKHSDVVGQQVPTKSNAPLLVACILALEYQRISFIELLGSILPMSVWLCGSAPTESSRIGTLSRQSQHCLKIRACCQCSCCGNSSCR